ncbi:autotransporter outer membrane beta-barrel domain-containing protein [Paraburkholderia sp. NPDC080076]|uniref:autotransporter outer membrane beta-barrel domain-containing protein n=1 Tax=Paraburkholderia sp. NPDC080076 TaxID=3390605 RepID=UPI003CFFC29C
MLKTLGTRLGFAVLLYRAFAPSAVASCTGTAPPSGTTVACTGAGIPAVAAQTGSTGVTINVDSTAVGNFARAAQPVALSVDTGSAITSSGNLSLTGGGGSGGARGAVLLGVSSANLLTNASAGVISTTGAFNDGMAANGSNNTLTNNGSITTSGPNAYGISAAWGQTNLGQAGNMIVNTGTVSTSGSNARAASILGGSGTVNNSGQLSTTGAAGQTVYMQGNADHLINTGTITASGVTAGGTSADAVFSNTAGSNFTALIENRAGGQIISQNGSGIRTLNGNSTIINAGLVQSGIGTAITMGNGNDSLILQSGSVINGSANGGAGSNTVTLQGSGTASNAFTNFQTLLMQGTLWNWTGTGTFTLAHVQTGTLNLTGTLGTSAAALVDAGSTLQANAQTLPQNVTDNGLVRFAQDSAGTYGGLISGTGSVEKAGAGTLTLAPAAASGNSYSGGTVLTEGTLSASADSALGAASGGVTFNGGTLQLGSSFNLAATRAITIAAGGGTIDTQDFQSTITQNISGAGALNKVGTGMLILDGANSYAGGTTVSAGTLVVGDAASPGAALGSGGATTVASGATLGGYGSVTGDVTNNGTISVANALAQFDDQPNGAFTINGQLVNAGLAQIGNARSVGNTLTVSNYVGQNGTIALGAVLAGDNSASDKLVVNGGKATGSSTLQVTNAGGAGAPTLADGIQVVQAANGARTDLSAFRLSGGVVAAGAYDYYLAKGGVTNGTSESWYLRNTVPPAPSTTTGTPTGTPPTGTPPTGTPGGTPTDTPTGTPPGTPASIQPNLPIAAAGTPPLPSLSPNAAPMPLYRPEVAIYAEVPSVARQLGILQVDNFHDRQGEQSLLSENGTLPAAWGRVWGGHSTLSQSGDVNPEFDGSVVGVQAGHDIYADTTASGQRNHFGFFIGFARATGDVSGLADATPNADVGHLAINAYSLGGYWTHVGAGGWYTDAVVMGSSLVVDPSSRNGIATTTHGNAVTGSLEGGLPLSIGYGLTLEPQAQLIWQHLSINDLNDGISTVTFNNGNTFVGRFGVRLAGHYDVEHTTLQPYLRLSVLRSFGSDDKATFAGVTPIVTTVGQTAGQIGAGVVAKLTKQGSAFATVSYVTNLGGEHQRTIIGNAGVRWAW